MVHPTATTSGRRAEKVRSAFASPEEPPSHKVLPGFLPGILQPPPSWGMQTTGLTSADPVRVLTAERHVDGMQRVAEASKVGHVDPRDRGEQLAAQVPVERSMYP